MNHYIYLILFLIGCFFYAFCNEVLLMPGPGFGALFLAVASIMKAYYLAQDELGHMFPEHLILMWKGLQSRRF